MQGIAGLVVVDLAVQARDDLLQALGIEGARGVRDRLDEELERYRRRVVLLGGEIGREEIDPLALAGVHVHARPGV